MGVKYVKDFSFPSSGGFHSGSVQRYAKGGHVTKVPAKASASAKGMPARAKPNAPAKGAPKMESKPKVGKGRGYADGGNVERLMPMPDAEIIVDDFGPKGYPDEPAPVMPPKAKDDHPYRENFGPPLEFAPAPTMTRAERIMQRRGAMGDRREMAMRRPGVRLRPAARVVAPVADMMVAPRRGLAMYAKGGEVKGKSKVGKVMGEYKRGELHSGSKKGPKVTSRKQAVAIALSEARKAGAKIPKKAEGGPVDAYGNKKEPFRGSPKKARELGRKDRRAREAMERAEKYAPGLSVDMKAKGGKVGHEDVKMDKAMMKTAVHKHERSMHPGKPLTKLKKGGVPSYGRKPMYGGGKC